MRLVTLVGLCEEVGVQTYAASATTHFKIQPGSIGAEKHQYEIFPSALRWNKL